MTNASETIAGSLCKECHLKPCETPGFSESYAYTESCLENRKRLAAVFWSGVALVLLVALAAYL